MISGTLRMAALALAGVVACQAQERFGGEEFKGEFKGFAKSPSEHIINRFPGLLVVRAASGEVLAEANGEPLANALFEIRGPGASEIVKGARTNKSGRFRLRGVRPGDYVFKVTPGPSVAQAEAYATGMVPRLENVETPGTGGSACPRFRDELSCSS